MFDQTTEQQATENSGKHTNRHRNGTAVRQKEPRGYRPEGDQQRVAAEHGVLAD